MKKKNKNEKLVAITVWVLPEVKKRAQKEIGKKKAFPSLSALGARLYTDFVGL